MRDGTYMSEQTSVVASATDEGAMDAREGGGNLVCCQHAGAHAHDEYMTLLAPAFMSVQDTKQTKYL